MQVHKFGGSSLADATRISAMMDIVHDALTDDRVILVNSAISGCTDELLGQSDFSALQKRHNKIVERLFTGLERKTAQEQIAAIFAELAEAPSDDRLNFGELFSTKIIALRFAQEGINTLWIDSRELIIVGDDGKVIVDKTYTNIKAIVDANPDVRLFVAPGFIASDQSRHVTNLGRGGSDYSAALYAAAVEAVSLKIWTDVPGIMSANPKLVNSALTIPLLSYEAAFTLAENGAKVLYAPTVKPAMDSGIPIQILSSFSPKHQGTTITSLPDAECGRWLGVTSVDLPSENKSRLCLVGEAITEREATSERIVRTLEEKGIRPSSGVYGEGLAFFVDTSLSVAKEAVLALHREFIEARPLTTVDLYIAGYGAVGRALVELMEQNSKRIAEYKGVTIRISGIGNSKKYLINPEGIIGSDIDSLLASGSDNEGNSFIEEICKSAARKSIFVDCTNDDNLYIQYERLFKNGINIVTSNRRSLSIPYAKYMGLKSIARENGCFFRYETTVGTSLPVLESIASSVKYSDGIEVIEALVSCSLNKIITSHENDQTQSFASLLKQAQEAGLTEEDPRFDICGFDVRRKLLIIAREAGIALEEEDVKISPFVGQKFFDCSLEDFYSLLAHEETSFIEKENELKTKGLRQRFVASLKKNPSSRLGYEAEIKAVTVGIDNPFYWITGTENVIIIRNEHSAPLIIKGAGEGVRLAASGIIKDILS